MVLAREGANVVLTARKPNEIAETLHIGVGTVGTYRTRILRKMNMTSTTRPIASRRVTSTSWIDSDTTVVLSNASW